MLGPRRNNDTVIRFHFVGHVIYPHFAFTGFDTEKLVTIIMDLFADIITGLNRHHNQLQALTRIENTAKIVVLFRQLFNVVYKTLHRGWLL